MWSFAGYLVTPGPNQLTEPSCLIRLISMAVVFGQCSHRLPGLYAGITQTAHFSLCTWAVAACVDWWGKPSSLWYFSVPLVFCAGPLMLCFSLISFAFFFCLSETLSVCTLSNLIGKQFVMGQCSSDPSKQLNPKQIWPFVAVRPRRGPPSSSH